MQEHKQLFLHKPEEGIIGDCFRTCVACILDKRPEELPHGFGEFWEGKDVIVTPKVYAQLNKLLANWDCRFIEYPLDCNREQLGTYLRHYYTDLHMIIGCNSKNGGHSVVMRNDDYIWDPSIDNSGCVGPMDDGYYWVGMLVRLT